MFFFRLGFDWSCYLIGLEENITNSNTHKQIKIVLVLLTNPFLDFEEWSETAMPRVLAGSCQSDTGQSINLCNKALPSYMYDVIFLSIYSWVWMDMS